MAKVLNDKLWKHIHRISLTGMFCSKMLSDVYEGAQTEYSLKVIFPNNPEYVTVYDEMIQDAIKANDIDKFNSVFRSLIERIYITVIGGKKYGKKDSK